MSVNKWALRVTTVVREHHFCSHGDKERERKEEEKGIEIERTPGRE
jgi:hypothetical protein